MLEANSAGMHHSNYFWKNTGHKEEGCELMELSVADIGGAKAFDIYSDLQKLQEFANEYPIEITRDEDRVYRFYFWMRIVRYQDPELIFCKFVRSNLG